MSEPDLICVGDVMVDVSVAAPLLERGGDVHGEVRVRPGGSATNAAVWAASAGARVRLHGKVGDDLIGRLVQDALRERGVEPALAVSEEASTGTMLVVHEEGERSMVADRGANAGLRPADLPERLVAGAVLVSGYLLFHHGSEEAGLAALERAEAPWVAIDAASWPLIGAYGLERFFAACERASVLLANEQEANALAGVGGVRAAELLAERFAMVCVKRGAAGAVMAFERRIAERSADRAEALDPTGAGDAFDGVLLSSLVRGASPEDALEAACRAGASAAASPDPWPALERRPA